MKAKPIIYSVINLVIAGWVLSFLRTGGWLTHHYAWNDPNTVNFFLTILQPVIILTVIAYWIRRTVGLYKALFISFVIQLIVAAGLVALFAFFFLTWKPKMM